MLDRNKINEHRFFLAAAKNDLKTIRKFINNPKMRAFESKHHLKPIEIAAMHQNWNVVLEFAKYKADEKNQINYSNALLLAVKHRQFNVAYNLLLAGAKPNRTLKTGEMCTDLAIKKNDPAMVSLLFRFGANFYAKGVNQLSPYDLAQERNQWQTTIPVFIEQQEFEIEKTRLINKLNTYTRKWICFHRKRAESLSVACLYKANSIKELIAILELQMDLFNPKSKIKMTEVEMKKLPFHERLPSRRKDAYNKIIEDFHRRLMKKVIDNQELEDEQPDGSFVSSRI